MTVNEAVKMLKGVETIRLATEGYAYDFNPECALHVAAFGDFDVESIQPGLAENSVEIELKRRFVKSGVAV